MLSDQKLLFPVSKFSFELERQSGGERSALPHSRYTFCVTQRRGRTLFRPQRGQDVTLRNCLSEDYRQQNGPVKFSYL